MVEEDIKVKLEELEDAQLTNKLSLLELREDIKKIRSSLGKKPPEGGGKAAVPSQDLEERISKLETRTNKNIKTMREWKRYFEKIEGKIPELKKLSKTGKGLSKEMKKEFSEEIEGLSKKMEGEEKKTEKLEEEIKGLKNKLEKRRKRKKEDTCPYCGAELEKDAKFCVTCGHKL